MAITNTSKPTTTFSNTAKVSIGETWASITTTWASETRTWLTISQLFTNTARQSSSITNTSKPA
jgi:hypothetical protein